MSGKSAYEELEQRIKELGKLESYRQTEQFRALLGTVEVLDSPIKIRTFTQTEE